MRLIGLGVSTRINLYRLLKMGILIYGHRRRRNPFISIRMLIAAGLLHWIALNRVTYSQVAAATD